jgi:signal transduction histidine kinase
MNGMGLNELLPIDQRNAHVKYCDKFFKNPYVRSGRLFRGVRKDGTLVPMEVGLNSVTVEEKVFAIAFVREVREMMQFDSLKAIINGSPDGIVIVDVDSNVREANCTFCEIMRMNREDILTHNLDEYVPDFKKGGACTITLSSGEEVNLYTTTIPINDTERRSLIVLQDQTVQAKYARELMEARNDAMKALSVRTNFLSNVNHELRTPLSAMLGFLQLMEFSVKDPDQLDNLQAMKRCGNSLRTLIDDILDSSKIVSGHMNLRYDNVRLSELICEIRDYVSVTNSKDLDYVENFHFGDDLVRTDPMRFKQIVLNLLSNSFKFTDSGFVSLTIEVKKDPKEIHVSVEDSGCGVLPENVEEMFSMFSRGDNSAAGTGLGLAISKNLATLMGGELVCTRSGLDEGSVFSFYVPYEEALSEKKISDSKDLFHESLAGKKILIADDYEAGSRVVKLMLEMLGCECDSVGNGKLAVEAISLKTYDMVLMDIFMPVMNGWDASVAIKQKGFAGPIIALSASTSDSEVQKCKDSGMDDFIAKPYEFEQIREIISKYL